MGLVSRIRNAALPLIVSVLVLALWRSPVVLPLKLFVVFLHEASHGLAAVVTGGSIERIELSSNEGGLCVTRGGWQVAVLSAGYLGSMLWGVALLLVAARTRWDRAVLGAVGVATLLVTLAFVRTWFGFGYGMVAGVALLAIAWRLPEWVADGVLQILGTTSALYAVYDIASDVLLRSVPGSDAHALADITWIPSAVWGVVWISLAVGTTAVGLWFATRPSRAPTAG